MAARKPPVPPKPSAVEWIVAACSVGLIVAVLGILGLHALKGRNSPPDLSVRPLEAHQTASGWTLDVEVANAGDRTAASVSVEGAVGEETSTLSLDYVPGEGRREATLLFDTDPHDAELRVTGWVEP